MAGLYDGIHPDYLLIGVILAGFALRRLVLWIRDAPSKPNPWDTEVEQSLQRPEATPVCHRCFTPQPPGAWFCEHCGRAVGPYNNLMPYVNAFSQGEVARNGVMDRLGVNVTTVVGYVLFSFAGFVILTPLFLFTPLFWIFLVRNLRAARGEDSAVAESEAC